MNMQIRFTPMEEQENRLHMQALQQRADQDHLAPHGDSTPPRPSRIFWAGHALAQSAHVLWLAGDEFLLELADALHGHRPHRHHHAH